MDWLRIESGLPRPEAATNHTNQRTTMICIRVRTFRRSNLPSSSEQYSWTGPEAADTSACATTSITLTIWKVNPQFTSLSNAASPSGLLYALTQWCTDTETTVTHFGTDYSQFCHNTGCPQVIHYAAYRTSGEDVFRTFRDTQRSQKRCFLFWSIINQKNEIKDEAQTALFKDPVRTAQ